MSFDNILFYVFSIFTALAAVAVVSARNPVHAVLWLIFSFFNAAGLFVLLGAEFVAMLLVIVYVGAVAVLFLFVVMMLNIKTATLKKGFQAYLPIGLILASVLFIEISAVIISSNNKLEGKDAETIVIKKSDKKTSNKSDEKDGKIIAETKEDVSKKEQFTKLEISEDKSEKTELLDSVLEADEEFKEVKKQNNDVDKETNTHLIGNVLYTDYFLMFQVSGLILLVAMIGAIVLTHREREGVKRQDISKQNSRSIKNSLEIVKVESGKGIN